MESKTTSISSAIKDALFARSRKDGCNIEWLAKASGISQSKLYRRMNSGRWKVEEVDQIAETLGVKRSKLM